LPILSGPSENEGSHEGHVDKLVPGETTVIEDVVVGFENLVREPVVAHELPNIFDWFNSGDFGGNGTRVMLPGTGSFFETCHPA
jgi:hypothetical protein